MRRDLEMLYAVLTAILEKVEKTDDGIFFLDLNYIGEIPNLDRQKEHAIEGGLLKVVDMKHPETTFSPEYLPVKVTWKGQCFLDLFEIWAEARDSGNPAESLAARIALAGFH